MKNKISAFALGAALCATLAGCEKDGEIIYTNGADSAVLEGTTSEIVLDKDHLEALVMTVYWNDNGDITLSNPLVAAPDNAVTNVVQLGADPEFSNFVEETMEGGVYTRQYTCGDLNNLVSRLGFEGGVRHALYVRVKSYLSNNINATYSNVLETYVTPYFIDMSTAFYLNASQEDTGRTLWSPASDGVYSGFIGASGWENWWLLEGNNTMWGNDGVDGTAFLMGNSTTGLDIWNFWYPAPAGCYYTVVNTNTKQWSALLISELSLGGDVSGEMTFNRVPNTWTYTYTSAAAGTVNITVSGTGKQYDMATGTDDEAAVSTTVGFGGSADALTFGNTASQVSVNVPAGEVTLVLDLSDPKCWKIGTGEAPVVEEPTPAVVYLPGVTDPWDFNSFLTLYHEDSKSYAGVNYMESEYGYQIAVEELNWDDVYTMASGDATGGTLEFAAGTKNNIPGAPAGIYLFDVSLANLSYTITPVTSVTCTGMNDDWSLTPMTQSADEPCVFTAELTKTADTPWGVKIVINDDWGLFFGGNGTDGELVYNHDGFTGDNQFDAGTVLILTVDLAKGTYSYTEK